MPTITTKYRPKEPIGLQNGGHVILRCSRCNKQLVDFWITRPNECDPTTNKPFEWQFAAQCCYCGDKSYIKKIYGGFHRGPATDNISITDDVPFPGKPGVLLIQTMKKE